MIEELSPGEISRALARIERSQEQQAADTRALMETVTRSPSWTAVNDRMALQRTELERQIKDVTDDVASIMSAIKWVITGVLGAVMVAVLSLVLTPTPLGG